MADKNRNYPEVIRFTEEMFLNLLKGKDLLLVVNAESPEKRKDFLFKGPFDGRFMTNEEITNMQMHAEYRIVNMIEKLTKEYHVKSEIQG